MEIGKKRTLKLIAGVMTALFMGVTLAWSVFVVPIEEYFGWTRSQTSLAFTINIIAFALGSLAAGNLSKYFSFHQLLKAAPFVIAGGFFLTGHMTAIWQLYLGYGILVGGGIGFGYNCLLSSVPLWFPEKSATTTGTLLMGYAFSTAVFGPILNTLIGKIGIFAVFKLLAAVCGIAILFFGHFIRVPSLDELNELPQRDRTAGRKARNIITRDMLCMPLFWIYYIMTVLMPGIGNAMINHNSPILTEAFGSTATFAAMIVSVVAVCNGLARFCFGFVFDKLGVRVAIISVSIICLSSISGVLLSIATGSRGLYIVSICLCLVSYGCNATMMPSVVRELFGHRTFSLNYSVLATDSIFSSLFPTLVGSLQALSGSYALPMTVLTAVAVVNMAFMLLFLIFFTRMEKQDYSES